MEFYGIARSLNPRAIPLPKEIKRKLNVSYGGAEDPANDTDRTAVARNTQFEFWVASWLTAGEKPIRMAEPDLQFAYRFQWRGLAAKRVRSSRQILKRVERAADQVKKDTGTERAMARVPPARPSAMTPATVSRTTVPIPVTPYC